MEKRENGNNEKQKKNIIFQDICNNGTETMHRKPLGFKMPFEERSTCK